MSRWGPTEPTGSSTPITPSTGLRLNDHDLPFPPPDEEGSNSGCMGSIEEVNKAKAESLLRAA